ncbi:aminodeoxychorismate lyase [Photobacterium jeanii]|uniref:Aminodeoxychorismate lyase n=1 Tax=Photobacterium jeanii TaxID=858640 RepID=A0A178KLT2_9GAMM|nr:aminodeoxychorismate lyase [Photobacterium jeanii]OAN18348.1 aminodeoxychorismate lyase [Photobacterium jeanii]PST91970.1 aminodeoxychorismate lyase [Photobacterium jeanii]
MARINGCEAEQLIVTDRATQYGDGCFTTLCVKNGLPWLWDLHLARFQRTLDALAIPHPDWQWLTQEVSQLAAGFTDLGVIKVLISRGSGGRGYSPAGCHNPNVVITTAQWPHHYHDWQQQGIALGVCQQALGLTPMLAGHKHLNRLEQVLLKQEIEQQGWQDAVVRDVLGQVVETSASNIFWRKDQTLYTPDLSMAGVCGVMREQVIRLVASTPYCLQIVKSQLDTLLCADEVFITNALMALVPVNQINDTYFTERTALTELNKRLYSC